MSQSANGDAAREKTAAMFIDYDNLYTILDSQSKKSSPTSDYADEIVEEVRRYLEEGDDTPTILSRAYASFDLLPDETDVGIPATLHRRGIEPVHVPAAMQENTSEIRLTIDLTDFLTRRADVRTVVVVTGDRPYLPLVRWIREQGARPLVAAVNPPQTSDAPAFEEDSRYLDARNLLSQNSREDLLANAPESGAAYTRPKDQASAPPQQFQELTNPIARRAVEITEEYFGQYDEVYLTPLLRKLSDVLGPDHDPKSLVSELEAAGAARLEKRNGYPYNYTVLIVNDDHPDVEEIHDEYARESSVSYAQSDRDAEGEYGDEPVAEDERTTGENGTSSHHEPSPEESLATASKAEASASDTQDESTDDSVDVDEDEEDEAQA